MLLRVKKGQNMKAKILMIFTVVSLVAFCYWGVCNDIEAQTESHTKVVHETVAVYY